MPSPSRYHIRQLFSPLQLKTHMIIFTARILAAENLFGKVTLYGSSLWPHIIRLSVIRYVNMPFTFKTNKSHNIRYILAAFMLPFLPSYSSNWFIPFHSCIDHIILSIYEVKCKPIWPHNFNATVAQKNDDVMQCCKGVLSLIPIKWREKNTEVEVYDWHHYSGLISDEFKCSLIRASRAEIRNFQKVVI